MTEFKKPDKALISLGLISLSLIFIGQYELVEFDNINNYSYIRSLGFFLQVIIWSFYYYKYHYKKRDSNR